MKNVILALLLFPLILQAQTETIENLTIEGKQITAETAMIDVTLNSGAKTEEMQLLYDFENINKYEFTFDGESIKGRYYVLRMKEFLDGKLIETSSLFDERGNKMFKIDSSSTSFKLISKIDQGDLKIWLRGQQFGSKQSHFALTNDNGRYVAKDFFGSKKKLEEDINKPFHLMAIITPNRNPDGSGSYCRVAQSEIAPELFGTTFNIPHYYLIEIEFFDANQ
ncbi:hypothetical protein [Christiangramia portivictoriae]|uniref:hypothetical protein n=1 Tax=Christiangramia portivictoriae TaxID=326069 RepID=UPI000407AF77|nr:hypothetical protein [Christiangramia portivictoriae]